MSGKSTTVAAAPARVLGRAPAAALQRKCACGGVPGVDGECAECKKKRQLQRSARSTSAARGTVPSIVHDVLREPGAPLDAATRDDMSRRFGHDFSSVRVHSDPRAAESARAVDAHAYTVGDHVVFDQGKYQPHAPAGRHLLAHELAHTVQQHGLQRTAGAIESAETPQYRALEREADRAATAALNATPAAVGMPSAPIAISRVPAPVLSRVAIKKKPPPETYEVGGRSFKVRPETAQDSAPNAGDIVERGFFVDAFYLPDEKGPVSKLYQATAEAHALVASVKKTDTDQPTSDAKQERDATDKLRASWLQQMNWPTESKLVDQAWLTAGGEAPFPRLNSKACHIDHIIELQLGGTNVPNNLQVLDPGPNMASGGMIKAQVFGLASEIAKTFPKPLKTVRLVFEKVKPNNVPEPSPCPTGKKDTCVQVNSCARNVKAPSGAKGKNDAATLSEYSLTAGAASVIVEAQPTPTGGKPVSDDLWDSSIPRNKTAAQLIPGLILYELIQRPGTGNDTVRAGLDPRVGANSGTRAPELLQVNLSATEKNPKTKDEGIILQAKGKPRTTTLKLTANHAAKIHYRFLSDGTLDLAFSETGVSGKGIITSSLPLLNRLKLPIELRDGSLNLVGELPVKGWSPFPYTTVTRADVTLGLLPEFKPAGTIALAVGPASKPVLTAVLTLSADTNGLVAVADIKAHLPGVDSAGGKVEYRNGEWSGSFTIASTQIKIPGVKKGELTVAFTHAGPTINGGVDLLIAEKYPATLTVKRDERGRWLFDGKTTITLPILEPIDIAVTYDGEHFYGEGRTGFKYHGLTGHLHVRYRDGKITGDGTLDVHKGRANGSITVILSERQKLSGHGDIDYQFSENLIGKLGIVVPEEGPVRVVGGLTFPKPIPLFRHFGGDKRFFDYHIDIPILGISVGPVSVGLIARINAGLGAHYGIGPGTLEGLHIVTAFNPLEPDPNIELEGGAKLVVPAEAGVDLSVRGALGVSAGIASVTGGITVTGSAGLQGALGAEVAIRYQRGHFAVKAVAGLSVKPVLGVSVDADITAEAGAFGFTVERKKVWHLAGWSFPLDAELGMSAPIEYDSQTGLKLPAVNDIKWTPPTLDVGALGKGALAQARGTESAKN